MSTSQVLLGILAQGPAHGYDIKHAHDRRFPGAKPLAFGQVYATLSRLERDGFVDVVEVTAGGGPERTVYAITAAGRQHLASWLGEVEAPGPYTADTLVRKTVTALYAGGDAEDFLVRQRTAHVNRMRELVAAQREQGDIAARIAIDHGIAHLDADISWLETAAARVSASDGAPTLDRRA
jgi:DNA-binding PadR family transcriptional regulator